MRKWSSILFYIGFIVFMFFAWRQFNLVSENYWAPDAAQVMAAGAFHMGFSIVMLIIANQIYSISEWIKLLSKR